MTIFVFGNLLIHEDSVPVRLLPRLKKNYRNITFIHGDPNEDLILTNQEPWLIIDTIQGIKTVTVFHDIDSFCAGGWVSPHDYDLGFHLKLLKKLDKLGKVTIIGIPLNLDSEKAYEKLRVLLDDLLKQEFASVV